jgi:hypothetical protein
MRTLGIIVIAAILAFAAIGIRYMLYSNGLTVSECATDGSLQAVSRNLPPMVPPVEAAIHQCASGTCTEFQYRIALIYSDSLREMAQKQHDYCVQKAYEFYADYYQNLAETGHRANSIHIDR